MTWVKETEKAKKEKYSEVHSEIPVPTGRKERKPKEKKPGSKTREGKQHISSGMRNGILNYFTYIEFL